jgi:hypothetical protein
MEVFLAMLYRFTFCLLCLLLLVAAPVSNFQRATAQASGTLQFSAATYNVLEDAGSVEITVTRTGGASGEVAVDYATSNGTASDRSDYTAAFGTLRFAPGETAKTFTVFLNDNHAAENVERVDLSLSWPTGGATLGTQSASDLLITDDDVGPPPPPPYNPIDEAEFFVRRHYQDFLNRDPDPEGLAFWTNQITECGTNQACIEVRRINVSAAFFLSAEFQETGFFVWMLQRFSAMRLLPHIRDFMRDAQTIGHGVVVGREGWQELLRANKDAYAAEWYRRNEAILNSQYGSATNEQFVDRLFANVGVVPTASERQALIDGLNTGAETRATVFRKVAEHPENKRNQINRAFVYMQYIGYLRRDPFNENTPGFGYGFWLNKLEQFHGDYVASEMVKAFITSGEYRQRFTESAALPEAFFVFGTSPHPEQFTFKLNDAAKIDEARSLIGQNKLIIGMIIKEPIYYNRPWSFYLDPDTINFIDGAIEVCDSAILPIEMSLDAVGGAFLPGKTWCPWGAQLLKEIPRPNK